MKQDAPKAVDQKSQSENPYVRIAHDRPLEIALGSALITMIDPGKGYEDPYNRWYEDEHFYEGAMAGPWHFAGRRWVAPWRLQELRFPAESPIARPVDMGAYISTYWVAEGHHEDATRWSHEVFHAGTIEVPGRFHPEYQENVYTAWHEFCLTVVRDKGPMRPEHALDYPSAGLVVEFLDARHGTDRATLHSWLQDEHLPAQIAGSAAVQCVGFVPVPWSEHSRWALPPGFPDPENLDGRTCLLWFLDEDPEAVWSDLIVSHAEAVERGGMADLVFAGGFVPTLPGTNRYVDELRKPRD